MPIRSTQFKRRSRTQTLRLREVQALHATYYEGLSFSADRAFHRLEAGLSHNPNAGVRQSADYTSYMAALSALGTVPMHLTA